MEQTFKTQKDYIVHELQAKVLLKPLKKGWEKTVLKDYVPAKDKKFKGSDEEHVEMYIELFVANCFHHLRIKISHKKTKTLGEIVDYLNVQIGKRARYGNKW